MKNILVIENQKKVSKVIKTHLEREGYKVYWTTKGVKGIEILKTKNIKLVIIDLMLSDMSGKKICKIIRRISNVHIFMIATNGKLNDIVECLNIGADQYVTIPFNPNELIARINALFRRLAFTNKNNNKNSNLIFDKGRLVINYSKRFIKVNGQEVKLTPNEFEILYTLAINRGRVLTRAQIINKIFGIDFEGYDRTIDVHIKNIRKKIEKDTRNPKYIITVVKVGYKFCDYI